VAVAKKPGLQPDSLLVCRAMLRQDFHFELPPERIAQAPTAERVASRLLCLDRHSGEFSDRQFREFPELLRPGDVLVMNNSEVIAARLFGHKASGGKVELLVERVELERQCLVFLRASKTPKPGAMIYLDDGSEVEVVGRENDLFRVQFADDPLQVMRRIGHVPLPPYIQRQDAEMDRQRYQTVYAQTPGSAAAPTAGLHFDQAMLQRLAAMQVDIQYVTLHVGAGTFAPVREQQLEHHVMHQEWIEVAEPTCAAVNRAKAEGRRVIAIGTTAVRCLESAANDGILQVYRGDTNIFIYPPYRFQMVDALLTNFHLPESTLLMLVCAFAGKDPVLRAYRHAVDQHYRFFSYGDAMFIANFSAA